MTIERKERSGSQPGRTFIEEARREQIVKHTLEVIAEHGYVGATLARIAEHAGISKGVISYHFDGKDDLMYQVLTDYERAEQAFIFPQVETQKTASEALDVYLRRNVEFMAVSPMHLRAVIEIVVSAQDSQGKRKFDITSVEWMEDELTRLTGILEWGQQTGEFRPFDPRFMAIAIRGAIENIAMYIMADPEIDIAAFAGELAGTFMRATAAEQRNERRTESGSDSKG